MFDDLRTIIAVLAFVATAVWNLTSFVQGLVKGARDGAAAQIAQEKDRTERAERERDWERSARIAAEERLLRLFDEGFERRRDPPRGGRGEQSG